MIYLNEMPNAHLAGHSIFQNALQTVKEMPSNHTQKKIQISLYENKNASSLMETKKGINKIK
jgi:hypothetical protein